MQTTHEFGFSPVQIEECKRRTFWSIFVIERYGGNPMCLLKAADVHLRLPCADEMYENSVSSDAPFLDNMGIDPTLATLSSDSNVNPNAWLLTAVSIFGDVLDFNNRGQHHGHRLYCTAYETFFAETNRRLQAWLKQLPEYLQWSEGNLDRSIQQGYAGTFISMHTIYHFAMMRLCRYVSHAWLPPPSVRRNIRTARAHAETMLQLTETVRVARRELQSSTTGETWSLSSPFVGYAVLAAIDIVSAGGGEETMKRVADAINNAGYCMREIGQFWNSANDQWRVCEIRFYQIQNVMAKPQRSQAGAWLRGEWGMEKPIQREFPLEYDCVYGINDTETYFLALNSAADDVSPRPKNGSRARAGEQANGRER